VARSPNGRPPRYCSTTCRKSAYKERKRDERRTQRTAEQDLGRVDDARRLVQLAVAHPEQAAAGIADWSSRESGRAQQITDLVQQLADSVG
jgi:hypothetical protein